MKQTDLSILKDKQFIKLIEDFVFRNDHTLIDKIVKYKNKIPKDFKIYNKPLFRGMSLSSNDISNIETGKPFKLNNVSSWSHSEKIATAFVKDTKKSISNKNLNGIIFKKVFTPKYIILNIQLLFMFIDNMFMTDLLDIDESTLKMGLEEGEILIEKGITLNKNNIIRKL
jgi:hypothetical protein